MSDAARSESGLPIGPVYGAGAPDGYARAMLGDPGATSDIFAYCRTEIPRWLSFFFVAPHQMF